MTFEPAKLSIICTSNLKYCLNYKKKKTTIKTLSNKGKQSYHSSQYQNTFCLNDKIIITKSLRPLG